MPINADNSNNNDPNKPQDQIMDQGPQALTGSGQANAPAGSGRVASFSSGAQPGQTGSGRFTNLQKYIGANQGSGERLGSRIGANFNRNFEQQNKDISGQNTKIQDNVSQGRQVVDTEGKGFQDQLGNIGNQLGSFKSMEDRAGFDAGAKAAMEFTQAPTFNRFQNIQAGSAIDNDALNQMQQQASTAGTALQNFTGDQLGKIQTEQGRYDLLQDSFNKNRNPYSAGSSRLDNLFLQAAPSTISGLNSQMNAGNMGAQNLVRNIGTQGQNISKLLDDETNLITGFNTQATANQEAFNKLGDKGNIDFIQKLRDDKYNEYLNQLKTGQLSKEVTEAMGLNNTFTYQPGQMGANPLDRSANFSREDAANRSNIPMTQEQRDLRLYNTGLDKDNVAASYLKKGAQASTFQDIATEDDYNTYKALQSISGVDTGKLAGASQLDKAVQAQKNLDGRSLSEVIGGSDEAFKNLFAGKDYSAYAMGRTGADDRGNFLENTIGNIGSIVANTPANLSGILQGIASGDINSAIDYAGRQVGGAIDLGATGGTGGTFIKDLNLQNLSTDAALSNLVQNDRGSKFNEFTAANNRDTGGQGTGAAYVNIDDYIKSGDAAVTAGASKTGKNLNTSAANSRQAVDNARAAARSSLTSGLDSIISNTGVKNVGQINKEDTDILKQAKRFSRLV